MTAKEAEAYVGDVSCNVNTLQDDKLFLDPPSTTPKSHTKRQKRDTTSEPLELLVGWWVTDLLGSTVTAPRQSSSPDV